ncbi:hypothetical protein B0H17DRAFT_956677 [Mycena rosella]|uniref:DUF3533 domain-containing protein n=1 Tax=Mycena rosella TaxID=1033263 RepID=A0AAD7G164_MYCRO|nr:hypothetical protein B0H17DRAFT_956677 [Mycena rosella]
MNFLDKSPAAATARGIYLHTLFGGTMALSIVIFAVFSIYWGSVYTTPARALPGWIVDFDGGFVGESVVTALKALDPGRGIAWQVIPASQLPSGIAQLNDALTDEKTWFGLAINAGASANLTAALSTPDASYNPSAAITFVTLEARNEDIYPVLLAMMNAKLDVIVQDFALQAAKNLSSSANLVKLLSTSPQTVTMPIGYTVTNLRPFDVPLAEAVTFVGLIYMLILSFFIVMISNGGRLASGLDTHLTLRSLITLRLVTPFIAYFVLSLFYTLLSRAFQLPFDRNFGRAGFVIFWMLSYLGMLACGLAVEAMITLLTIRFIPFFLLIWIISNVAVCVFPLQVLPIVYRYGYAAPFYNISRAVRSIVFRTKNDLGLNFGILIAWVVISCITLPTFQWITGGAPSGRARRQLNHPVWIPWLWLR